MHNTGLHIARSLFAALFLIFNVGLPVLVNSCPMPKPVGSMMCPLCHDDSERKGEVVKGKPCCSPSIAAERNTNEFLTIQKIGCDPLLSPFIVPQFVLTAVSISSGSQTYAPTPSQFAPDDIPVIHSSLLI
jgi:hypothetical protein